MNVIDLPERIAERIVIDDAEHWMWQGSLNDSGYGRVTIDGQTRRAHRAVWELLVGPIADGHVLDHLCRLRACVNPHHLEPVTVVENTMRGLSVTALKAAQEVCTRGLHLLAGDNLIVERPRGRKPSRRCRACRNETRRSQRAAA